jgi:Bacterial Ig domain/Divergent InlB B-repeat domain
MKKTLIVSWIFTVLLCCKAFGEPLDRFLVTQGTNDLANGDLVDANTNFLGAVAFNPANEDANVLLAITRLLLVPQTPAGSNFLNGLNFPPGGRDIFNWTSSPPRDAFGGPTFPAGYNSTNMVFFFRTNIMPQIASSLTNFANLTDTSFLRTYVLGGSLGQVTIDYGDVQMFQAGLYAADFFGYTLDANNASVILPQIVSFADTNGLTIQRVLATYPSLLTPHNTNDLIPSQNALENAANFYLIGSDFIRNDRAPDDTNDLITLSIDETNQEADFRMGLSNVVSSLSAPTQFDPNDPFSILDLEPYFSGKYSVRKEVPQFFNNTYVENTLPDYTFGGVLPDEPAYKTETAFRNLFVSRAGIYTADDNGDNPFAVSDNFGNNSGAFAVYISTNGQSTLFGYDGGIPVGFLLNFTVDARGKWQTSNSVFMASGSVGDHGDFNGEIDFLDGSGLSVFLQANEQPPQGPFQNNAGFYTGSGGGTPLDAILAADGELFFVPISGGQPNDFGDGTFFSATQFTIDSVGGTTVQGTLNLANSTINGNFTDGNNSGTFTLSRSKKVNFDVPPTITSDLPANINIPMGNTLKLTLSVTGSAPLSYQWYLSGPGPVDPPIPGAISNTLVISNNLLQSTGQYQIWATVDNVAGGTNSQICTVNVSTETNVPTVKITSPTPGQLWSNAQFTVTGTASDKVGITGVFYYVNNGLFAEATNTSGTWSTWTAGVTLTPGTNTIYAYAYNVGGVVTTNSVKMVFVQTAFLTVITNGPGTITPAYPNALRLGQVYPLTATGAKGYKLGSWTGGTNQPFSVYTNGPTVLFTMSNNLTMEANFIDTNQPLVKITNVPAGPGLVLTNNNNSITYTVMGTATGVEMVGNVQYSLNGAAFTQAATSDNWTNWSSAQLSLQGGTNLFSAYATGTNGINSATNTVRIFVVSSNVLQISVSGKGTIAPNYSNAVLRVGQNYTVTATPLHGWVFTNWTGAVSGSPMIPITTKPALTFLMQSNLMLQANFVDTNQPFVKITNAVTGLVLSSNTFTLMGTVTDDVAIASVNCTLNGNPVLTVTTNAIANGVSWSSGLLSLAGGTNFVSVYAVATNGNVSAMNNLRLIFISTNQLTLQTSGQGTISPNYSNAWLRVGQAYTMTATPAHGWTLTSWSGSTNGEDELVVLTNKPTVFFTMFSNLVMQANFTDTNKPVVKITNAPAAAVVTNQFILRGTATDDVAIASVSYSLDGNPFTLAATNAAANGVSWSADLALLPGTNKFAIYAVATNGNISATNSILIIRTAALSLFPIATNANLTHPQADIAFDGTNYFVVFSYDQPNTNGGVGQFVSPSGILVGGLLNLNPNGSDDPPYLAFDGGRYLTAWADFSDQNNGVPVNGAFVGPDQTVYTPTPLSQSTTVNNFSTIAYGGGVYLLSWSDGSTSPSSIEGAIIDTSGNNQKEFVIGANGQEDEAGGSPAAFDGNNFLVVWASKTGNFSVSGQLVDTSGNLVGNPILIYSTNTAAAIALPSVVFDGTKYLVLFNTGLNANTPGSFHIQGRFVTTDGQVLANKVSLTSDAGPQIIAGAAFDGVNYLISWNQGLNPFAITTSATINGRFFDSNGVPTSAEFPIFKTQGARIPLWGSMLYDNVNMNFVLAAGLGKMTTAAGQNSDLKFTNGVIYGAFVSP